MSCGTCCTGESAQHAEVTGDDWSRIDEGVLGDDADHWAVWTARRAFMRMHEGRCIALEVKDGRFTCAIYLRRPEVCRALLRDSPACAGEIALKTDAMQRRLPLWRA